MAQVIVVTSGKGGVGKTTTSASMAAGMAMRGFKTVAIDFDVGLRNLDLIMGCERRVVYDLVNVVKREASLRQALIRDKRCENLFVLPASQTRDKDALDLEGVGIVIDELKALGFDYIICDSPAGIEKGAQMAMYFADEAIVVTNPEVSSVRDSDRVLGLLDAKTRKAELGVPMKSHLLITRYSPERAEKGEMLAVNDIIELLGIPFLGVIPESRSVLQSSNQGTPVVMDQESDAAQAYVDAIKRFLGEEQPHRFLTAEKRGFFLAPVRPLERVRRVTAMNKWLNNFWKKQESTASVAKDRLQIIVARERTACANGSAPGYLPQLQQELLQVIAKYEHVDLDRVHVSIDKRGDSEVLELCIMLPEDEEPRASHRVAYA